MSVTPLLRNITEFHQQSVHLEEEQEEETSERVDELGPLNEDDPLK